MKQIDRIKLLVNAAEMYYLQNETQDAIARRLKVSRSSVSRLLSEAQREGIVQIKVRDPLKRADLIAQDIEQAFGLKKAIIVPPLPGSAESHAHLVAGAAAEYLWETVEDNAVIASTWGTTLRLVADALPPKPVRGVKVVQCNGAVGRSGSNTHAEAIIRAIGAALSAETYLLPVPAIVDSPAVRDALVQDSGIRAILDLARQAHTVIFTVGYPSRDSVLVEAGYFSHEDIESMKKAGAVGDICSRYIDVWGNTVDPYLDARTVGLEISSFRDKARSILIASGEHRAAGILGALRGKYANTLITDLPTAQRLLCLAGVVLRGEGIDSGEGSRDRGCHSEG